MNSKRGYVPEDDKYFSPESISKLQTASRHVQYLINEGYDLKQATTFVGNHFLLSERQRLAIMRSLATADQLALRQSKQVPLSSLASGEVWIDGFNTIITLEVMLSGSPLFACMDGTIRDLAALRGTYRLIPETSEAVHIILDTLQTARVHQVKILLDEPVSNSGRLKSLIAEIAEPYPYELDIQILRDVDRTLYGKDNVITTDSIILDHCKSWVNFVATYLSSNIPHSNIPQRSPIRPIRSNNIPQRSLITVWTSQDSSESKILIRKLNPGETEHLKTFLYEAIFIPEGIEPPPKEIIQQPELRIYYEDFGSGKADHCLVAEDNGQIIGAVWTRIMNDYGHVNDQTPSFAISLFKEYRGKGIGTKLMREMLTLLKSCGCKKASLAVQKANYAVLMYEKLGFKTVEENDDEYIMVCML